MKKKKSFCMIYSINKFENVYEDLITWKVQKKIFNDFRVEIFDKLLILKRLLHHIAVDMECCNEKSQKENEAKKTQSQS